jgi:hypothetical protein
MTAYFQHKTSAATLAVFRIALGAMLFASIVRFWSKGWITELYINPKYFFPFYGFEFVKPLGHYTYFLFGICAISAILVALGLFYRIAITCLFLSFTYIELIDKCTYLNHYYFISLICLMLIFIPAHVCFSLDAYRNHALKADYIPAWCVDAIKLMIFILYFYAGIAKLNSDWLLHALPLKIWLPARNDIPVLGPILNETRIAYLFSWFGCVYDLTIVFFLLNRRTRTFAYATVVIFHLTTAVLFPIGMFPFIMIVTAIIFFSTQFHQSVILKLSGLLRIPTEPSSERTYYFPPRWNKLIITGFVMFLSFQIVYPFRYVLYPGELFWTEEGYRFSWRVMLMEKAGYAQFMVKEREGKTAYINNSEFLTPLQEKMMSTQPDMILQYAHLLRDQYVKRGFKDPQVYAEVYVTLNGRLSKQLVDPGTDLAKEKESFAHKSWIPPLGDEIKGF